MLQALLTVGKHIHSLLENEVSYEIEFLKAELWAHVGRCVGSVALGSSFRKKYKKAKKQLS